MATKKRTFKLTWRTKRARHGRKGALGKRRGDM